MLYIFRLTGAWTLRILIHLATKFLKPKSLEPPPKPFKTVYVIRKAGINSLDEDDSTKRQRKIRCDIYIPKNNDSELIRKPLPIVLNLHGSGFVMHSMGDDAIFCQQIANQIPCIVVDIDYAKAPELPFPNANLDIDTVLRWIQGQDELIEKQTISFKKSLLNSENNQIQINNNKIALTGFSSGGNLVLTACIRASSRKEEFEKIKAVIAFYPSTNLSESPWKKPNVKPGKGESGGVLPAPLRNFFYSCYIPLEKHSGSFQNFPKRSSPSISPLYASSSQFPKSVTIITCSGDSLAREAKQLAEHIVAGRMIEDAQPDKNNNSSITKSDPPFDVPDVDRIPIQSSKDQKGVLWWEAKDQGHAWDKMAKPNTKPGKLREEAYSLTVERIRLAFE